MATLIMLNIGAMAASLVPLAFIKKPTDPMKQTSISIGVGNGGSVPHVAIWGEDGAQISQFKGAANGHTHKGETWQTVVGDYQNGMRPANPTYVSVVIHENDAICVAAISVSGNGQQWIWIADMASFCGAQWMESDYTFQGSNSPMRCAWIDAYHTNNIIAKRMSMHIQDFTGDPGCCGNVRRTQIDCARIAEGLTFWPDTLPDAPISVFNPPLEYTRNTNENENDSQAPDTTDALKNPDVGIDRGEQNLPDDTNLKGFNFVTKKDTRGTLRAAEVLIKH